MSEVDTEAALQTEIDAATGTRAAVLLNLAKYAWGKKSDEGKEFTKRLKEVRKDKSCNKRVADALSSFLINGYSSDTKNRLKMEGEIRKIRGAKGSDTDTLARELISRMWIDTFGLK